MFSCLKHFQKFPEKSQGSNGENGSGGGSINQTGIQCSTIIAPYQRMGLRNETGRDTEAMLPLIDFSFFLVCSSQIELKMVIDRLEPSIHQQGMHRPADCCNVYTSRKIRCVFMESYFETSSRCSQPAVIFITKGQQKVCANPGDEEVQKCLKSLNQL